MLFSFQFASQDLGRSGPNPWKLLASPIKQRVPGPPNPWKTYCAGQMVVIRIGCTQVLFITSSIIPSKCFGTPGPGRYCLPGQRLKFLGEQESGDRERKREIHTITCY